MSTQEYVGDREREVGGGSKGVAGWGATDLNFTETLIWLYSEVY